MAATRSKKNQPDIAIDDDIKEFFNNLVKNLATIESIQPLVTNDSMNDLLNKLEERISVKFEQKISEQAKRITELESTLVLRQKTVDALLENVEIKIDNNEQYSRRDCLRIHGIEAADNEDVGEVVVGCFKDVGIDLGKSAIDRTHRVGNVYEDRDSKKKVRSIIVKFRSWDERSKFYRARPTAFSGGKKKPGVLPFHVSLDLTHRRYNLLKHARELIENNPRFLYAFADINCSLAVRDVSNKNIFFNSYGELDNILNRG